MKIVYACWSDAFPICGLRRRPYIVLLSIVGVFAYLGLAFETHTLSVATMLTVAAQVFLCGVEVLIDAIVVERVRHEERPGSIQAATFAARSCGSAVATVMSAVLFACGAAPQDIFAATSCLPLVVAAASFAVEEEPPPRPQVREPRVGADQDAREEPLLLSGEPRFSPGAESGVREGPQSSGCLSARCVTWRQQAKSLWSVMRYGPLGDGVSPLWVTLVFLFAVNAVPTSQDALGAFMYDAASLSGWQDSIASLFASLGALAGAHAFRKWLTGFSLYATFLGTSVAAAIVGTTRLLIVFGTWESIGLAPWVLYAVDNWLTSFFSTAAYLPILVLAARVCPPGVEATVFGALTSADDIATTVAGFFSAALTTALSITRTDFGGLWLLCVICAAARPLPVLLAGLCRRRVFPSPLLQVRRGNVESDEVVQEGGGAATLQVTHVRTAVTGQSVTEIS